MRWIGKVVGALVGLAAGPLGAMVGAVIGHGYDLSQEPEAESLDGDPALIGEVLFETAFGVMGYLAKADGRVSEAEIDSARAIMQQLHLDPPHVQRAIAAFNRGKLPGYPVEAELARLRALCGPRHELLRVFLEIEMRAALAGNDLKGPVRGLMLGVAKRLGFEGLEVAQLEAVLRLQRGRGWSAPVDPGTRLDGAYQVLGITAAASDEEVKKAYRRQMNENHPDKLVARGLPESMQDMAKEKTQRIREAYEAVCEHRGIR